MSTSVIIAIDGMGGDAAPAIVVEGMAEAYAADPTLRFRLFGRQGEIIPHLNRYKELGSIVDVIHCDKVVSADDKPAQALRRGRDSSMGQAIQAVQAGEAQVAVSAGNTGALMALSIFILRTLPGIERPALVGLMPTREGDCVMLDLGANVLCDEDNLIQFAIMGAAYARTVKGLEKPTVGLLNIGSEDMKGNDMIKGAADQLRMGDLPLTFAGFVEADKIAHGPVDVVVTDGFTGNVALKAVEGTAKFMADSMREAFSSSIFAKIGYLFASGGFNRMRRHLHPDNHNGGVLLGLNGLVVKSHGGASAAGFARAIKVAANMTRNNLTGQISDDLAHFHKVEIPAEPALESIGK